MTPASSDFEKPAANSWRDDSVCWVMLNWNDARGAIRCIESIRSVSENELSLVIVDNGSTDNSVGQITEYLEDFSSMPKTADIPTGPVSLIFKRPAEMKTIHLIQSRPNLGYAVGQNKGIRHALSRTDCAFLVILNGDTVVQDGFTSEVLSCFEDPRVGIVSPLIVCWPDTRLIWYGGGHRLLGNVFHRHRGRDIRDVRLVSRSIDFATGCALIVRRSVFDTVGFFDERFFMYGEDVEFSRRVGQKYKIMFCPRSIVAHDVGRRLNQANLQQDFLYYGRRNLRYLSRNLPEKFLFSVADLLLVVIPSTIRIILRGHDRNKLLRSLFRGIIDAWR